MKKIISLFQRDYGSGERLVRNEIVPGAEWVVAGEGVATRKWDGTCCMMRHGLLFKRYDAKHGKTPPEGFLSAQDPDPKTGHWPGWLAVRNAPEDWMHNKAVRICLPDGTYELVGPKINGNPDGFADYYLMPHGLVTLPHAPRDFDGLKAFLSMTDIEGIVWHHPDGRMVKIKGKDFGIQRGQFAATVVRQASEPFHYDSRCQP